MNLKYKVCGLDFARYYDVNCVNVCCYRYWRFGLPEGCYKHRYVNLQFWNSVNTIINKEKGIKITWGFK